MFSAASYFQALTFERSLRNPSAYHDSSEPYAEDVKRKLGVEIDPAGPTYYGIAAFARGQTGSLQPFLFHLTSPVHEQGYIAIKRDNPTVDFLGYWSLLLWPTTSAYRKPRYYASCAERELPKVQEQAQLAMRKIARFTPNITYLLLDRSSTLLGNAPDREPQLMNITCRRNRNRF